MPLGRGDRVEVGKEGTPMRIILTNKMCVPPYTVGSPCETRGKRGIIVDRELPYPAVPHPKYVAVGILPRFLYRDGLLTLINMASFMGLTKPWGSLSMIEKLFTLMGWPIVLLWSWKGEGALECSLYLSQRSFPSCQCIPLCIQDGHIYACILTFLYW